MTGTKGKCRYYVREALCRKCLPSSTCMSIGVTKNISKIFQGIRKTNNALSFRLELQKSFHEQILKGNNRWGQIP
jgi:hypothetical protein